ncbi:Uncharacterised protein [uncultured Ruminococcus sp.]|nr:Uncharacterised protein [uncultured Ruminococcus sp.]
MKDAALIYDVVVSMFSERVKYHVIFDRSKEYVSREKGRVSRPGTDS